MPKRAKRGPRVYECNPICLEYDWLSDEEMARLVADIEQHGQRIPAQLDADGRLLDGKNRQKACLACMPPRKLKVAKWRGPATEERYRAFVESHNDRRRHETESQRSIRVAKRTATPPKSAPGRPKTRENVEENRELGKEIRNVADFQTTENDNSKKGRQSTTVREEAKAAGVSLRTLEDARRVLRDHPDQVAAVESGEKSLNEVLRPAAKTDDDGPIVQRDRFGREIPEDVADTWAETQLFSEIEREIQALRRRVIDVCGGDDALKEGSRSKPEPFARFVRLVQFAAAMKQAAGALHAAQPYALCAYCCGDKCKACQNLGWMPRDVWQLAPEELRKAAGS